MDLETLLAAPPCLHEMDGQLVSSWKLADAELRLLGRLVEPGHQTIETGAGLSTVVFALKGARHTAVVPDPELANRICTWCEQHGIPTDTLEFITEGSETALPRLAARGPVHDVALIDGSHAFPMPFMDWFWLAQMLREGGRLIVDDLHIWTCEFLVAFLAKDENWELAEESLSAAMFVKTGASPIRHSHYEQKFIAARSREFSSRAKLRYLSGLLERRNFPLLGETVAQGIASALRGQFGKRERR